MPPRVHLEVCRKVAGGGSLPKDGNAFGRSNLAKKNNTAEL